MRNRYNLDTAKENRTACSLKTEYTVIEYVPVAGARASATSAVRRDVSDRETERTFFYKLSACLSPDASDQYWLVNIGLLPIRP